MLLKYQILSKVRKKAKIRNQYIQAPHVPDPGHRMGKRQKHNKASHTREPIGQPFTRR